MRKNYDEFELIFNDLTLREDSGSRDQAIDTINKAFDASNNSIKIILNKYKDISISLKKELNVEGLQILLNPNIEIKGATKEEAISQLKDKSSFFHRHLLAESWSPEINLEIIVDNKSIEIQKNLHAEEALKVIKKQKDDNNIHFNLTFLNSNEVSKLLQKEILKNCSLNIRCTGLDCHNAQSMFKQIKFEDFSLELSGSNKELAKAIQHPKVKLVEFIHSKKNVSQKIYNHEARKRINQMKVHQLSMKIENLDSFDDDLTSSIKNENLDILSANEIINICKEAKFNINFMGVRSRGSLKGLSDGQFNVSFDNLGQTEANELIKNIRKLKIDFNLAFNHLNTYQLEAIMQNASLNQENMEVTVKTLNELFMNEPKLAVELSEFAARGIEYLLEINEKRFIPWRSITIVGIIGALQMVAGAVLIATGFGADVGMGLITEGVADMVIAYRAYSTRQFSWSAYVEQKAVSLVISITSMGMQNLKDAGKGIKNLVLSGVKEEVLEQAGTQVATNFKNISKTLVQSGNKLKSLAFKQMGVSIGETAMREGINKVSDSLRHFSLELLQPKISEMIQNKVKTKFLESNLMSLMCKFHALDNISNSKYLTGKIEKIIVEIINPEHKFWFKHWDSISGPICKGILSDPKCLGSSFSMGMRILGILNGMYQIKYIIDGVHNQLLKKLVQIDKETLSIPQLLHQYCQINQKDTTEILKMLKIDENGVTLLDNILSHISNAALNELNPSNFQTKFINPLTNLLHHNPHKKKVIDFCTSLNKYTSSAKMNDFSNTIKLVSDLITDQVIRITESQLISPITSYEIGAFTNAASSCIQNKIISITENPEEIKSIKKPLKTYAGLINHEAKKYTISYSQCENIHYAQQKKQNSINTNNSVSKEIENHVEAVKKDKPADIADMFTMAAANGIHLKISDDPNYQLTEEEKAKCTKVVFFTKSHKDIKGNNGHIYQLKHANGQIIDIQYQGNDSGYAVFAELTGKSFKQLRNETAQEILANPKEFSKAIEAQSWIKSHYPEEANSLLFCDTYSKNNLNIHKVKKPVGNLYEVKRSDEEKKSESNGNYSKLIMSNTIYDSKKLGKVLRNREKSLKSLVFNRIKVYVCNFVKRAMRRELNKVSNYLKHFSLDLLKPKISKMIQNKIKTKFLESNLMSLMCKFHVLDSISNSNYLTGKIKKITVEIINSERKFWHDQWGFVDKFLNKIIRLGPKYLRGLFRTGLRILKDSNQIKCIIDGVHNQLLAKLLQIDKETLSIPQLLHQYCQINQKDTTEILKMLKIDENGVTLLDNILSHISNAALNELNPSNFQTKFINPLTNLLHHNPHKKKVIDFCTSLNKYTSSAKMNDFSNTIKLVSDLITDQVIRITESQLISPITNYGRRTFTHVISRYTK